MPDINLLTVCIKEIRIFIKDNIMKICPICGKEFESSDSRQKYCSEKCYLDSVKKWYHAHKTLKKFNPIKCSICGKEFTPKTRINIYCSPECKHEAARQQMKSRYWLKKGL